MSAHNRVAYSVCLLCLSREFCVCVRERETEEILSAYVLFARVYDRGINTPSANLIRANGTKLLCTITSVKRLSIKVFIRCLLCINFNESRARKSHCIVWLMF